MKRFLLIVFLLLLFPKAVSAHTPEEVIEIAGFYADISGFDRNTIICMMLAESGGNDQAIGDQGLSVGPWQWTWNSWITMRRMMKMSEADLRTDPYESTNTALFALQHGYARMWKRACEICGTPTKMVCYRYKDDVYCKETYGH